MRARSTLGESAVVTTSEITFAKYQRALNQPQVAAHSKGTIKKSRATLEPSGIVLTAAGPDRDMLKVQAPFWVCGETDSSCSPIFSIVIAMRLSSMFCDSHSRRISVTRSREILGVEMSTCSILCCVTIR
jgi:hypothetical protein